mgnify:CR=1 FL=1
MGRDKAEEEWGADWGEGKAGGEPAAEAARLRPVRTDTASVRSAVTRNRINEACPVSSAHARNAGLQ